jgi:hypothetical protein
MNNIKIKLKTSELTGAALDWAVAKCELGEAINEVDDPHFYSTDWALAGPIIERDIAKVERFSDALWEATAYTKDAQDIVQSGPTPLIAAMRCYVTLKLGDEVEVPEELKEVMA